jgi:diguanylate cyclase (GGDEF)-like protein
VTEASTQDLIDETIPCTTQLLSNAKIMMVDDEPLNMEVLQVHLETEGYSRFVSISDSLQAMEAIRAELPDVLLLDLVMPMVSGFDILRELRIDDELKNLPVIVLTSSDDADTKLRVLQLGATDFLLKPVDASELALRMRNTLSSRAYQQRLLNFDQLTDLPNRSLFTRKIRSELEHATATGEHSTLILFNINRFKTINDSLGPARGDEVLWAFSERLKACFKDVFVDDVSSASFDSTRSNILARVGGDRFAVLIQTKKLDDKRLQLSALLDTFVTEMEKPFLIVDQDIYLNVSIGVSTLTANTISVETLLNDAETAMMHAKERRDTHYAFYAEQMDEKARELMAMENGMRTAVENGEVFLVYQPKVNVANNTIVGAEALVRWMHPEFGLISPVNFIPLAEDTGMIVSIGEWVLRESCRMAREWRDSNYEDFKIAVNVSIRQLHELDFISTVKKSLDDFNLPAEALIVELTENMIMENAESNIVKLQQLKELGVQISIDDFGTGYSSLSYLQRFPLDQLKIDRSFIKEIKSANDVMPIVKAVISLAHDLGLSVVAEGIETHHQLAHIRAFKCEEYQGYYCSKPMMAEEFTMLLSGAEDKSA